MCENEKRKWLKEMGSRVKFAREELGLTQEEFSVKHGYARSTFGKIEAGLRDFKSSEIVTLAKQLGVSCDYLLCQTWAKSPEIELQAITQATGLTENAVLNLTLARNATTPYAAALSVLLTQSAHSSAAATKCVGGALDGIINYLFSQPPQSTVIIPLADGVDYLPSNEDILDTMLLGVNRALKELRAQVHDTDSFMEFENTITARLRHYYQKTKAGDEHA
ncbi:MAG: helix-turn-helix domain-containing protein [Oscillospiraceae bacterium]|nr:helix-turn-helix domain-containing protein [Oscillospiraceae bacterium]